MRTLLVWPDSVDLVRFDSMQLSVAAQDDRGEVIPDVPVTFSSNNTFVVGVSGGGLVRSLGPVGSATVTVAGGGDTKRIPVTVFALPARVIAAPRDTAVPLGQSYPLRVEVLDSDGAPLTSPAATYESSNLAVATVSAAGSVTAVGSGTAAIIVRAGGASAGVSVRAYDPSAPAVVEVVPQDTTIAPLGSYQLGVRVISVGGQELSNPPLTFQSSNEAVATVSPTGVVASGGPGGVATITVRSDTARATAMVAVVDSNAAAVVEVEPSDTAIAPSDSFQLRTRVISVAGQDLPGAAVTYQSSNEAVVTVSPSGMVVSVGPTGVALVTLRSDTARATATVRVADPNAPAVIVVEPRDTSVGPMGSYQLRVRVLSVAGEELPDAPVTYQSSNEGVATVSSAGVVTSAGPLGRADITVSSDSARTRATVFVIDTSLVARLALGGAPFGLAVSTSGVAYVGQYYLDRLARVDMPAIAFSGAVTTGRNPVSVGFDPVGATAYVSNLASQNVGVVAVASNTQTETIPVTGQPVIVRVAPTGQVVWVTTDANKVLGIDVSTKTVMHNITLGALSNSLAFHPTDDSVLYAGVLAGIVVEIDIRGDSVRRVFAVGGVPQGIVVSPAGDELYVANEGTGALQVVNLTSGAIVASVPAGGGPFDLQLSPDGNSLWTSLSLQGSLKVVDRASLAITRTIITGGYPRRMAFDAATSTLLVANEYGWVDFIR